jgi:hypothetical protein
MLDSDRGITVVISWVPGHHDIFGNDLADHLAKRGSRDAPVRRGFTSAAFSGNLARRGLGEKWRQIWEIEKALRPRADFHAANKIPPTIRPKKLFHELDRKTFSRIVQCRTGHAHIGSYYDYFDIDEPRSCGCGLDYQTRNHILTDCEQYEAHRHLLADKHGNIRLDDILGTAEGLERLANFISKTGAFDKPPIPPAPSQIPP